MAVPQARAAVVVEHLTQPEPRALPAVSIIIPVLNEAANLRRLGQQLAGVVGSGVCEVIVVDAGSQDDSAAQANACGFTVLAAAPGRGLQMNVGASCATGAVLWFLHADTRLLRSVDAYIECVGAAGSWGFFPLRLSGRAMIFRLIERAICWRSTLSRVATGDQGIFVRRALFQQLGGFAEIPLMEDVALSKRLRQISPPMLPSLLLQTSSRRWEQNGVLATILLMWRLRFAYWCGVSPASLARRYYRRGDAR